MQNHFFISLSEDELKKLIRDSVEEAIQSNNFNHQLTVRDTASEELLRLEEVASMLKVSKVTIHTWKRKGLIPFYRISNKIYFKKGEVLSAMNKAKNVH